MSSSPPSSSHQHPDSSEPEVPEGPSVYPERPFRSTFSSATHGEPWGLGMVPNPYRKHDPMALNTTPTLYWPNTPHTNPAHATLSPGTNSCSSGNSLPHRV